MGGSGTRGIHLLHLGKVIRSVISPRSWLFAGTSLLMSLFAHEPHPKSGDNHHSDKSLYEGPGLEGLPSSLSRAGTEQ